MKDTSSQAETVLIELLRAAPVWRKLQRLDDLNQMVRALALSDLEEKHPTLSQDKLRYLLAVRLWGAELAGKVYGQDKG